MEENTSPSRSYTSVSDGFSFLRDGIHLFRAHRAGGVRRQVDAIVLRLQDLERELLDVYGFSFVGKRVLDIGAGQRLNQLSYFSLKADAIYIDVDVVIQGFDPVGYLRMLRVNGWRRAVKTLLRKALLVDLAYRRELARTLGVSRIPRM